MHEEVSCQNFNYNITTFRCSLAWNHIKWQCLRILNLVPVSSHVIVGVALGRYHNAKLQYTDMSCQNSSKHKYTIIYDDLLIRFLFLKLRHDDSIYCFHFPKKSLMLFLTFCSIHSSLLFSIEHFLFLISVVLSCFFLFFESPSASEKAFRPDSVILLPFRNVVYFFSPSIFFHPVMLCYLFF